MNLLEASVQKYNKKPCYGDEDSMQPRQCLMFMLGLLLKMCQEHQMREGYEANNFGDNIFWNVCKVCMCYSTIGICHPLEDTTIVTSSNKWKMLCLTLCLYLMATKGEGWHSDMNSFLQENNKDSKHVSYFASITKDIIQTENIAYSGFSVRGMWSNTMVGRCV